MTEYKKKGNKKRAAEKEREKEFKSLCSIYNTDNYKQKDKTKKVRWCRECGRPDDYQCYQCGSHGYDYYNQKKLLIHPEEQLIYCNECFDKYENDFDLPHLGEWLETHDADSAAICWKRVDDTRFNLKTGENDKITLSCHDEPSWYLDKQIDEITNIQTFINNIKKLNEEEKREDDEIKKLQHHLKNMKDNVANMLVTGCMYNHGERKKFEYIFDRRIYLKKIGGEIRIFNPHDYEKRHVKNI